MTNKHNMNLALADLAVCSVATSRNDLWAGLDSGVSGLPRYLANLSGMLATWRLRHKTRRQLAATESHFLQDVGISESQRFIEVNKSFWEA